MKTPSPFREQAPSFHVLLELPASSAPSHIQPLQPRIRALQGRTPGTLRAGARVKQGELALSLSDVKGTVTDKGPHYFVFTVQ